MISKRMVHKSPMLPVVKLAKSHEKMTLKLWGNKAIRIN